MDPGFCLNALNLFHHHQQSLEAPADYAPPSKISAICFFVVLESAYFVIFAMLNLSGLSENVARRGVF